MRTHTAALVAALTLFPVALAAQGAPHLGGQVSFAQSENAGLGLRLDQPLTPQRMGDLQLLVAFDYFFPNAPVNYWELNTDLAWGFGLPASRMRLYVGGGLNMARTSFSGVPGSARSDVGVNLLAGIRIPTSTGFTPFFEVRPELGGGNRFVVTTGVMF